MLKDLKKLLIKILNKLLPRTFPMEMLGAGGCAKETVPMLSTNSGNEVHQPIRTDPIKTWPSLNFSEKTSPYLVNLYPATMIMIAAIENWLHSIKWFIDSSFLFLSGNY